MQLTIFWRVILAQSVPIALILAVSVYAQWQLHQLVQISSDILTTSTASIKLEKQLQRIFLTQMRHAEKYVALQDKAFYQLFIEAEGDFKENLAKLQPLLGSTYEQEKLEHVQEVHRRYSSGLAQVYNAGPAQAAQRKTAWNRDKNELSDKLAAHLSDLVQSHEEMIAMKTAVTRDRATTAAKGVQWLGVGGFLIVVFLAYRHARSLSRPLQALTQALRRVGQGEFQDALHVRASREVTELTVSFNWMTAQLAELERMKADFVAHVSHELRTPITGIREGAALLLEQVPGPLTPGQYRVLSVVQTHCERLWHHIASILDVSKMEAGMMEYVRVPGDLIALLTRSAESVQLVAQKKQIQVKVLTPPTLPALTMDANRMQQVLDNLLSNAVKFTPPHGTITITARLLPTERTGSQRIEVCVTDTGMGIPRADQRRIFERFYQSPWHQDARRMGTGLGLAIARHIVEDHGGALSVTSQVDEGSTFRVILPIQDGAGAASPRPGTLRRHA